MSSNRNYPVKISGIIGQFSYLFAIFSASAASLDVHVDNLQAPGTLYAALYSGAGAGWEDTPVALSSSDSDHLRFDDLQPGQYALQLFQDLNGNQKLDLSRRGIPQEPVGLSGQPEYTRGRPAASECLFTVEANGSSIRIRLLQPPAARAANTTPGD